MKKLIILAISIMMILSLSSIVMAKAVKLDLGALGTEKGQGKVILNNPSGAINLVVQVNLKGAQPDFPYCVWIKAEGVDFIYLGKLVTNGVGNGTFHKNVETELKGIFNKIIVALDDCDSINLYWSDEGKIEIK